jgi:predicted aminopeptidase
VPGFEKLLADEEHNLPRFYAAARALAKLSREERRARLCSSAGAISQPAP